jgi:hypothetical protein
VFDTGGELCGRGLKELLMRGELVESPMMGAPGSSAGIVVRVGGRGQLWELSERVLVAEKVEDLG